MANETKAQQNGAIFECCLSARGNNAALTQKTSIRGVAETAQCHCIINSEPFERGIQALFYATHIFYTTISTTLSSKRIKFKCYF